MPNWAEGTLKIRGKLSEVTRFMDEKVVFVDYTDEPNTTERPAKWEYEQDDEHSVLLEYPGPRQCLWLKDSRRNFIDLDGQCADLTQGCLYIENKRNEPQFYELRTAYLNMTVLKNENGLIWTPDLENDPEMIVIFPIKIAWGPDENYYMELSKEFDLMFRLYVVEQGMGFYENFTCKGGDLMSEKDEIAVDGTNPYDLYARFLWNCPFPGIGG